MKEVAQCVLRLAVWEGLYQQFTQNVNLNERPWVIGRLRAGAEGAKGRDATKHVTSLGRDVNAVRMCGRSTRGAIKATCR